MEDNEFEEVTIISHTDHGTSVLPQSFARVRPRLSTAAFLKATQKLTDTGVESFGGSRDRLEGRGGLMVEGLLQAVAGRGAEDEFGFLADCPQDSGCLLFGAKDSAFLVRAGSPGGVVPLEGAVVANAQGYGKIRYILPWYDCVFVFREQSRVHIVRNGQQVVKTDRYFSFHRRTSGRFVRPWFDEHHVVFLAEFKFLVKLNRQLEVKDLEYEGIADMGIESNTKDLTLLFGSGSLTTERREFEGKPRIILEGQLSESNLNFSFKR